MVESPGKDVQEAILHYETVSESQDLSRLRIRLVTGRTHQIRCQFASRGLPLVGDRKYGAGEEDCDIALWSAKISFLHPKTGEKLCFSKEPPAVYPWTEV